MSRRTRIIAALESQETAPAIASREGVSPARVRKIAAEEGIATAPARRGPPKAIDEPIVSQTALRIGRRFAVWRAVEHDLSWDEAAEVIGMGRETTIRLERGTLDAGLIALERVATAMGVTVGELVG